MIDTYRWCMRCCTVLQDSATLYWDTPLGLGPFRVVAASYGHPQDPKLAVSVRTQLQTRVVSRLLDYVCNVCLENCCHAFVLLAALRENGPVESQSFSLGGL